MELHLHFYRCLIISGLVITLCLLSLYFYKTKTTRRLFFGLSVIAVLFAWPPNFLSVSHYNLERSKSIEFCGSCHEMNQHVSEIADPKSKSLAAKHATRSWINQNPCFTCHRDYTMFGPFEAKIRGLRHFYAAVFEDKNEEEIKLYDKFPDENCLQCHSNSHFKKVEAHQDRDADEGCVDCHFNIHLIAKENGGDE